MKESEITAVIIPHILNVPGVIKVVGQVPAGKGPKGGQRRCDLVVSTKSSRVVIEVKTPAALKRRKKRPNYRWARAVTQARRYGKYLETQHCIITTGNLWRLYSTDRVWQAGYLREWREGDAVYEWRDFWREALQ